MVPECGLEPTSFATSRLLPTNERENTSSAPHFQTLLEDGVSMTDTPATEPSSFPTFFHLSTLDSVHAHEAAPSIHATKNVTFVPPIASFTLLDEERPFLLTLKKRKAALTEEMYIQLRNRCMDLYAKDPHRVFRFEVLRRMHPTLSASLYCQLLSFWEHRQWIYHLLEKPSEDPIPVVFTGPLSPLPPTLLCHTCATLLPRPPYYQAIHQPLVYVCVTCFASGRFEGSSLLYTRMDSMSKLEDIPWALAEKIRLLECIDRHGIQRWDLIAKDMKKPMESCVLNFVTLSDQEESIDRLAPFEATGNPILGMIHFFLPFVPALAAHFAQQALRHVPDLDLRQVYLDATPFAFTLAKVEHEAMQPILEALFECLLKRIELKWEKLSQLDEWITRLATHEPTTNPASGVPKNFPKTSKRKGARQSHP